VIECNTGGNRWLHVSNLTFHPQSCLLRRTAVKITFQAARGLWWALLTVLIFSIIAALVLCQDMLLRNHIPVIWQGFLAAGLIFVVLAIQRRVVRAEKTAPDGGQEEFRALVDGVQDYAIFMLDPQGRVLTWNAGAERLKGYKQNEIIGQDFARFYPSNATPTPNEELRIAVQSGRFQTEGWRIRKDGSRFWAHVTIAPSFDRSGDLRGFIKITRNMAADRDSEARYQHLLESAPDGMVIVNTRGVIELANSQVEKLFGYTKREVLGKPIQLFIPQRFHRAHSEHLQRYFQALGKREMVTGVQFCGLRKDGTEFPAEVMLNPQESPDGTVVTAAIRDITERKKVEKLLAEKVADLKRSNDELEQFAYVASHDLQEPLRMVTSYMQLLSRRYKGRLDADADEFIAFAVDGTQRMKALINDLLVYSRAGATPPTFGQISSDHALDEALGNLRTAIAGSGAIVTRDPLPAIAIAYPQLVLVFQNLVGNAIKYRSAVVPHVHVSASKNGNQEWIFSVRDNGLGIEPQYLERIFVIFQRLHGRKEFEGTGIGLAICKKIVERQGGRIWVESEPGQGSTFRFAIREEETG
jgi:PAS domain S-box-containing protein